MQALLDRLSIALFKENIYCLDCEKDLTLNNSWEPFYKLSEIGEITCVRLCQECIADINDVHDSEFCFEYGTPCTWEHTNVE